MIYPFLQLEEKKARKNISKLVSKAKALNLELRPHFKTHQSAEIGEWFKEYGVTGITVSSLKMAEFFAENGWKDITVAFPLNILELDRINSLNAKINLKILFYDHTIIEDLNSKLDKQLGVYIEIDPKYGRSGIFIDDFEKIEAVLSSVKSSKNLIFEGFYAHAGHTYKCRGLNDIKNISIPLIKKFTDIKQKFGGKLCWGDTPSCSVLDSFGEVDQISPGNFVFYDWMQSQIGSCLPSEIAVMIKCPVIAKFPDRKEILIHGGAVHFSKDYIQNKDGSISFGQVINPNNKEDFSNYLKSISQEHGIIKCSDDFFDETKIGDVLSIYPIHSCLTANLMNMYHLEDGERIDHFGSGAPF